MSKKKSTEEINGWLEYRKSLLEQKSKSDDDFEKYITFIASGTLGLTLTFMENISPLKSAIHKWLIAIGWALLAITLLLNLYSHFLSSRYTSKSIDEIDDEIDYDTIRENLDKRNKIINGLNISSIVTLFLGIILILIFVIFNSLK